ncbi:cyclic lactone autoinducer peptide [Peptoclostridium sp. AF21-18]|nr:cyclic lactone autoinducer peptide [Peptoclostridium sp. AF21-18]RHQ97236.1 cyclic lactone autoinducer peptide [Peptoclostridium sp. AF21-18]
MKKILNRILKSIGSLAICMLFLSANTTSMWIANQPTVPKDVDKFRKLK